MLAVAFGLLFCVPPAQAVRSDDQPLPWAGGLSVESPVEGMAGRLASVVAGRHVEAICNDATGWGQLAAQQRFDAASAWGFVVFTYDPATGTYEPGDTMQLSEAACWYLDALRRAPPAERGKWCTSTTRVTVTHDTYSTTTTKRVRRVCPDYMKRVFALQTISHEAQHLARIRDEATAECNGMQRLAWFARQFGVSADQAVQMASDYHDAFYETVRPGTPYYLSTCPDPGS